MRSVSDRDRATVAPGCKRQTRRSSTCLVYKCCNFYVAAARGTRNSRGADVFPRCLLCLASVVRSLFSCGNQVTFYGPRSEFVVSGSDCGHIFFWNKVRCGAGGGVLVSSSGFGRCASLPRRIVRYLGTPLTHGPGGPNGQTPRFLSVDILFLSLGGALGGAAQP